MTPEFRGLHGLIEAAVLRHGERLAISDSQGEWSYDELNRHANQVAWHLKIECGIKAEQHVAVCLESRKGLVAALLGVLKAGGAFVCLDPSYPEERLKHILRESSARVLLSESALAKNIAPPEVRIFHPSSESVKNQSVDNLPVEIAGENLAYIIFTSGSTGVPKGVMISHNAIINHHQAVMPAFGLQPGDRVLQFCSPGFDVMVEEVFATLAAGASLIMKTKRMMESMAGFLEEVDRLGVTVLNLPTAFWQYLTEEIAESNEGLPRSVRLVIAGGEKVPPKSLARWLKRVSPSVRWINGYGPTETTITSHLYELPNHDAVESWRQAGSVPIGRPVANCHALILDSQGQPVPEGQAGELCIGGAGVARGYLNRPGLTAEKFVPSPRGHGRLFRTGDWVRLLPGGDLEFLGRMDDQVKIRGFRIETGEIESCLLQHPSIRMAVVLVRQDDARDPSLVAYYTLRPQWSAPAGDLRSYLLKWLPAHMVPSAFVLLDSFPLTPNGKIDRASLPIPPKPACPAVAGFVAPRHADEETMASLWRDLLSLEEVSAHGNFFDLGGHSLLAARLVSRASRVFQVNLTQRDLFERPTIAQLTGFIQTLKAARRTMSFQRMPGDPSLVEGEL